MTDRDSFSDFTGPLDDARRRGEANVKRMVTEAGCGPLEMSEIARFEELTRHGYAAINITVRRDGKHHTFEADWLARWFRVEHGGDR